MNSFAKGWLVGMGFMAAMIFAMLASLASLVILNLLLGN